MWLLSVWTAPWDSGHLATCCSCADQSKALGLPLASELSEEHNLLRVFTVALAYSV